MAEACRAGLNRRRNCTWPAAHMHAGSIINSYLSVLSVETVKWCCFLCWDCSPPAGCFTQAPPVGFQILNEIISLALALDLDVINHVLPLNV